MTPKDDMIERVARAICFYKLRPCPGRACRVCGEKAREALEAVFKPEKSDYHPIGRME